MTQSPVQPDAPAPQEVALLREFAGASAPAAPQPRLPVLLFTAFEPSGDDHASAVISELRRRHPDLPMYAWGGPKMARAGATLIERTGDDAVMGMPGLAKIIEHFRMNGRIEDFIKEMRSAGTPVAVHIPVDSPAANTPICKIAKKHGLRVVHLVAPQIWAWGRWRIHKLRRLTDLVLCMLPFEEQFFRRRNVPARFIGHFLFDHPLRTAELDLRAGAFGEGRPKIAMMPGSRPDELRRHFPILLETFTRLKAQFPQACAVVAATSDASAATLRTIGEESPTGWPQDVRIVTQDTDAVIRWCDIALVKSGTVTLQVARQLKPMVVFYKKSNPLLFLIARTFVSTKHFSLPNVLANRRIVPELVPHFGGPAPIVAIAQRLLTDPDEAQQQRTAVEGVVKSLGGRSASALAADAIEEVAGLRPKAG